MHLLTQCDFQTTHRSFIMIDILMAVYNGEKYLAQQIDSILVQSEPGWHLYINDDCSSDASYDIAVKYAKERPEKITVSRNARPSGSACANFMGMLGRTDAEYAMFCDQDDVWLPHKIKLTLQKMKELEKSYGNTPMLVHTELSVTDSELNVTAPSFTRFQGLNPRYNSLNRLLCQNNVTGCTVMINRALIELVKNAPADNMLMHDWWLALAAAAFGHIGFVAEPLIKYRQHGNNQLGAVNNRSLKGIAHFIARSSEAKQRINATYRQAECFYSSYKAILPAESKAIVEAYMDIPSHSKLSRAARLIKHGFLKQNLMSAAGQLIFC